MDVLSCIYTEDKPKELVSHCSLQQTIELYSSRKNNEKFKWEYAKPFTVAEKNRDGGA